MSFARFWMLAAVALLTQAAVAAPTAEEIANAIENLSDSEFEARQAATEFLWHAGDAAAASLEQAAKSTDPEVRTRANALLKRLRLGIRPDTPADVLQLIDQFRYAQSPEQRRQALNELQAKERWQTVLALIRGEQNPQERRNLATAIAGQAGRIVGLLVEKGEFEQAEEVLELVATTEAGLPQLMTFLLLTERIDKYIAATRERVNEQPKDETWVRLAYLLRAKGDLSGALEAAEKTTDLILRVNFLAEARRWSEAAPLAEEFYRRNSSRLEGLAFATTFYRLANDEANHQRTLELLLKAASVDRLKEMTADKPVDPFGPGLAISQYFTAAKTLLVNEQIDDALAIVRKINPPFAHAIYLQQHRHREALEFVGVTPEKTLDRAWLEQLPTPVFQPAVIDFRIIMAAQVARQLRELGRSEQVEQIWRTLRELEPPQGDRGRLVSLLMVYAWQLGRHEEATRFAADAIAARISPAAIFATLARREGPLALVWHERLLADDPQVDRAKAIAFTVGLVAPNPRRGGPPANWREHVIKARDAAQNIGPRLKAEQLVAFGQTCKIRGDLDLAKQLFAEAAEAFPATSMHLGDLIAAEGDWAGAAKQYGAAVKANPADPLAGYLLGYALEQAGDAAGARRQLLQANLAVLVPETRLKLAKDLPRPTLKEEAARQCELICRTALPDSQVATSSGQDMANLIGTSQPRTAATYGRLLLLHLLNPSVSSNETELSAVLPHAVHKSLVHAALADHNRDMAEAELARCEKLMPADIRTTVDFVPALRQAGMIKLADELFERAMATHRKVLEEFPTSATYLNNSAWLCARSQRELDEGLALALKAVELAPEEAAYQDTLAEICFQRGDREAAVAAAQKCLELAPANKMFATRLAHFRDDDLKTLDKATD